MTQPRLRWLKYSLSQTQNRLVLILTGAILILIIAVGASTYYSSTAVLQEELSEPQHQMLRISMNFIDGYIQETNQLAIKVALNNNVYQFLTGEEQASYANITELYQFMEAAVSAVPYIKSVYIYDSTRESFMAFPQGYSSNKITFVDSSWLDVEGEFGDRSMLVKKRSVPLRLGGTATEVSLFRKIIIQGEPRGLIAVNFRNDQLFAHMLPPSVSDLASRRYILDSQDNLVYEIGDHAFEPGTVEAAISQLQDRDSGEFGHEGKRLLGSQMQSPVTGWRYLSVVSQDSLLASTKQIRNVAMAVSVVALALGAMAIIYFNARAFKPVRRMRQLLSRYERDDEGADLINLEKITGELLTDHAQLSRMIRQTMPEAASKLLVDIYTGNMNGRRELLEKWRSYYADWSGSDLTVVMISIDDYDTWNRQYSHADRSLLKFAIINVVAELMAGTWRVSSADLGRNRIAVLLQPVEADGGNPRVGEMETVTSPEEEAVPGVREHRASIAAAERMREAVVIVSKLLKLSVSVGVSGQQDDAGKLRQAMLEAENALGYRLHRGSGSVIPYAEVSDHEMPEPRLQEEAIVSELTDAVRAGQEEQALRSLERIGDEIHRDYWYPSAALPLLELVAERLEQLSEEKLEGEEALPLGDLPSLPLDSILERLRQRVSELAGRFGITIQSKEYVLCQQMIGYMKQHLEAPIGVQEIADHTGISSSLASQLFKQEMNETIHGYFTKLRMERASELLLKTDHKISEIASMVGYQHENSFIRVYRKYKDITPGKYREMMRARKEGLAE
ncbi:helix-turn-helix domain-containing protein [Paenibacillus daejeonensis]|uniref:helix-turn-helix domain-containing protein n=1 Tax=Paenibacillus daejeonensis TaxID=135193 RepID=UPI000375219B|nr:helix-turn-helix domain-containing protein [Paenibacillus daejeonensis]